jgi:hypothetical protein
MLQYRIRFISFAVALSGLLLSNPAAHAELLQVPNGRGSTVPVYWEKTEGATATVVLLAGGNGQVKFGGNGKPRGNNFLIRTYQLFADQKLNVAVVGTADNTELSYLQFGCNRHHGSQPEYPTGLVGGNKSRDDFRCCNRHPIRRQEAD